MQTINRKLNSKKEKKIETKKTLHEITLLSEKSLSKSWLSKEDEEAFKYLQK